MSKREIFSIATIHSGLNARKVIMLTNPATMQRVMGEQYTSSRKLNYHYRIRQRQALSDRHWRRLAPPASSRLTHQARNCVFVKIGRRKTQPVNDSQSADATEAERYRPDGPRL